MNIMCYKVTTSGKTTFSLVLTHTWVLRSEAMDHAGKLPRLMQPERRSRAEAVTWNKPPHHSKPVIKHVAGKTSDALLLDLLLLLLSICQGLTQWHCLLTRHVCASCLQFLLALICACALSS